MDHQSSNLLGVMDGASTELEASDGGLLTGGMRVGEPLGARIMRLAEIASVLHLGGEYLRGESGRACCLDGGVVIDDCGEEERG